MTHTVLHFDDVEALRAGGAGIWHPIRRTLGVTAFGINAYSAEQPGDPLIERHDERSPGSGGHEEVYLVLSGRATFTVADEIIDAPTGTLLLVHAGTERQAAAADADTTVLVVGGRSRAAMPVSPYEHWYAAEPYSAVGDQQRAIEVASAGLADWPEHPMLRYQLACYNALAGDRERALEHLRIAYDRDPRMREWAADDEDLVSVRDDPSLG
jgi:hypothetical protein